jgi:diguanylate cyclase (GGDEF)-like protein/PAS domain S-box-containing protein
MYLRVGVPLDAPMAEVWKESQSNLGVMVVFAVMTLTMTWWLSNWILLRPVKSLTHTAQLLGSGVLDARSRVAGTSGELGELARRFNAMAEQLEQQHTALTRVNRAQTILGATGSAMLRAKEECSLLQEVCSIIQELGGFHIAWVGYRDTTNDAGVVTKAYVGSDTMPNLKRSEVYAADREGGPVLSAIRSGKVQLFHNLDKQSGASGWQKRMADLGMRSAVGLPIKADEEVLGGLAIFSADQDAFLDGEVDLLTETASDLGFGIYALRATRQLRQSEEMLALVVDNIPSMLFVKDAEHLRFISLNAAGEQLTGFKAAEVIGKTDTDLFPKDQADHFRSKDLETLSNLDTFSLTEEHVRAKTGEMRTLQTKKLPLAGADGQPKYLLGISEDVTDRRAAEQRLTYLASHDHLTGLTNRPLLLERLHAAWSGAQKDGRLLAVLYIDLDGIKEVNDMYGHPLGDQLLKVIAILLRTIAGQAPTVARIGGDEFIILLDKIDTLEQATAMAEQIRLRCELPFLIDEREAIVSASIGISAYPGPVDSHEALLRTADIAMYYAKARGRNRYAIYSPDIETEAIERLEIRSLLRHAVGRGELTLHYQPRISMQTGRTVGAEALVRWHSAELCIVSPARFIPIAEESGLIVHIGEWVLQQACLQAAQWQTMGHGAIHIAVNLSVRQLRDTNLLGMIDHALRDAGLDASLLELEVTESAFMDKEANPVEVLDAISAMGIRLAIDDFGTGYSSLAYLKQLPVDVLKIDQSFVKGLTTDQNDQAIVTAIVAMAKSLNLSVTAEGVETAEQLKMLEELACDEYQGYYASKPLPPAQFVSFLSSGIT